MSTLSRSASTRSTRSNSNGASATKSEPNVSTQSLSPQSSLTRRPSHKHNDYSCYIHLTNKSNLSLELVNAKAISGRWANGSPPEEIEANSKTLIEITDPKGPSGSEGQCTYRLRHPQKSNAVTFKLKFADPYWARDDNYLEASTQYPAYLGLNVLSFQNKGHPFIAHVEIDALQVPGIDRTKSQRSVKSSISGNTASTGDGDEKANSETSSDGPPEYHSRSNSSIISGKQPISAVQAVDIETNPDYKSHAKKDSAIVMIDDISLGNNDQDDEGAPGDAVEEDSNSWPEPIAKDPVELVSKPAATDDVQDVVKDTHDEQSEPKSEIISSETEDAPSTTEGVEVVAKEELNKPASEAGAVTDASIEYKDVARPTSSLPTIEEVDHLESESLESQENDKQSNEPASKEADVSSKETSHEVSEPLSKETSEPESVPTIAVTPPAVQDSSDSAFGESTTLDVGNVLVQEEQPEIKEEEISQPETQQEAVKEPAVTEPAVTEPAVTEPKIEQEVEKQAELEQPEVEQPEVEQPEVEQQTFTGTGIEQGAIEQPQAKELDVEQEPSKQKETTQPEIEHSETEREEDPQPALNPEQAPTQQAIESSTPTQPDEKPIPTPITQSNPAPTTHPDSPSADTDTEEEEYIRINEPKFSQSPTQPSRWASLFKSRQTHLGIVAIIFLSSWGYTATKVSGGLLLRFAMLKRRVSG